MIRLACAHCDTEAADGIELADALNAGWKDIVERNPDKYKVGTKTKTTRTLANQREVWVWWTHIGVCPECQG